MSTEQLNTPSLDYEPIPAPTYLREGTEFKNDTELDLHSTSGDHITSLEVGQAVARAAVDELTRKREQRPPTRTEISAETTGKVIVFRRDALRVSNQTSDHKERPAA